MDAVPGKFKMAVMGTLLGWLCGSNQPLCGKFPEGKGFQNRLTKDCGLCELLLQLMSSA